MNPHLQDRDRSLAGGPGSVPPEREAMGALVGRAGPGRREFLTLGIGALAVAALPRALRTQPVLVRRRIPVMGTVAEVAVPTRNEAWAQRAADAAFAELRRVEATMSRYLGESDVGRVNAETDRWVAVSRDTGTVLAEAERWASLTEGRFDPCLGRVSTLWDVTEREAPPPDVEVRRFAAAGLWTSLALDTEATAPRARLTSALAAIDLGGIAKGFGVDRAADALRSFGVTDGLVNVGGDLVALGADASGEPWRIGVRSPVDPSGLAATLAVTDEAVATSGDYLRFFEHGGRRYHHLLDPRTGTPYRTAMRSLTVRADRCMAADAAATALFGLGEPAATELCARASGRVGILHVIREERT